jgi:hypothetical protein
MGNRVAETPDIPDEVVVVDGSGGVEGFVGKGWATGGE